MMYFVILIRIYNPSGKRRDFFTNILADKGKLDEIRRRLSKYGEIYLTYKHIEKEEQMEVLSEITKGGITYYSRRKFCEKYECTLKTIYNWLADGKVKVLKFDGASTFYAKIEETKP